MGFIVTDRVLTSQELLRSCDIEFDPREVPQFEVASVVSNSKRVLKN